MTFEEMQQVIEGMLSVQRNLQEGQIRNQQSIAELTQNVNRLVGYQGYFILDKGRKSF